MKNLLFYDKEIMLPFSTPLVLNPSESIKKRTYPLPINAIFYPRVISSFGEEVKDSFPSFVIKISSSILVPPTFGM